MSFVSVILAPFALLFPGKEPVEKSPPPPELSAPAVPAPFGFDPSDEPGWERIADSFRAPVQDQVRIEQRITVRIAPHRPQPRRNLMAELPDGARGPQFDEKRFGDCVTVTNIAGVQVSGKDKLVLHLRDRRMISAKLERSCQSRDFYSGFYLQNSTDGRLCVDRDTLQSRSGASCKLTRFRQLVEDDD